MLLDNPGMLQGEKKRNICTKTGRIDMKIFTFSSVITMAETRASFAKVTGLSSSSCWVFVTLRCKQNTSKAAGFDSPRQDAITSRTGQTELWKKKKNTRFITLECSLQVMRSPWHVELFWMLGTDVISGVGEPKWRTGMVMYLSRKAVVVNRLCFRTQVAT